MCLRNLAIKCIYLFGHKFTVLTADNPLTYVITSAKLDATEHRWVAALTSYDFAIYYMPGKNNADANGLSRLQGPTETRAILPQTIKAVCSSVQTLPFIEALSISKAILDDLTESWEETTLNVCDEQNKYLILSFWLPFVGRKQCPDKQILFYNINFREADIEVNLCRQLVLFASQVPVMLRYVHDQRADFIHYS